MPVTTNDDGGILSEDCFFGWAKNTITNEVYLTTVMYSTSAAALTGATTLMLTSANFTKGGYVELEDGHFYHELDQT